MDDPRREVSRVANHLQADGTGRISLRTVWARVKLNSVVAGNNHLVSADLGVHATPTLFVIGRLHEGAPSGDALDGIIQTALAS